MSAAPSRESGLKTTAYGFVWQQLRNLISDFGLQQSQPQIHQVYRCVFHRSLDFPLRSKVPALSRINHDGIPFQLSVRPGGPLRPLQFLGETVWPGASGPERLRASHESISTVTRVLGLEAAQSELIRLLELLAPESDPNLLADPAGAFWIGAAFAHSHSPQMRVYVNGSWGAEESCWRRFRCLAAEFGAGQSWIEIEETLPTQMKPLGSALTIAPGGTVQGRIYLTAYGKLIQQYQALAETISGAAFAGRLRRFMDCLLGEDRAYPTPTGVCSFGLGPGQIKDFKLELCCHCLFTSDLKARQTLTQCFEIMGADPTDYLSTLEILSEGHLEGTKNHFHSFAGIGVHQDQCYFPVYLKPKLVQSE